MARQEDWLQQVAERAKGEQEHLREMSKLLRGKMRSAMELEAIKQQDDARARISASRGVRVH